MTITPDTIILSIAAVVGPATAVIVGAWIQRGFAKQQQKFERQLAHEIENRRSSSETSREITDGIRNQIFGDPEAKYRKSISQSLSKIAAALESSSVAKPSVTNGSKAAEDVAPNA
jgi:hypothetical protein